MKIQIYIIFSVECLIFFWENDFPHYLIIFFARWYELGIRTRCRREWISSNSVFRIKNNEIYKKNQVSWLHFAFFKNFQGSLYAEIAPKALQDVDIPYECCLNFNNHHESHLFHSSRMHSTDFNSSHQCRLSPLPT